MMKHDHVQVLLNFYLLTPASVSEWWGLQAKYLLLCFCIRDSLILDMQNDHVLKNLNFDLFTPSPRVVGGWGGERGSAGNIFATKLLLW